MSQADSSSLCRYPLFLEFLSLSRSSSFFLSICLFVCLSVCLYMFLLFLPLSYSFLSLISLILSFLVSLSLSLFLTLSFLLYLSLSNSFLLSLSISLFLSLSLSLTLSLNISISIPLVSQGGYIAHQSRGYSHQTLRARVSQNNRKFLSTSSKTSPTSLLSTCSRISLFSSTVILS